MFEYLLTSWRMSPVWAAEDESGGGSADDGNGNDDGGEGDASGTPDGGGRTELAKAANEGQADGSGAEDAEGGDATGEDPDPRDAVPEDGKYEFSLDDQQFELSEDAQAAYAKAFSEAGLTQKQADTVVAAHTGLLTEMADASQKEFDDTIDEWLREAKTDKVLGADWSATMATANRALKQFGDETLVAHLDNTGLGNHPSVLRFLSNIGKAISEDRFASGDGTSDTATPKETAWYGKTTPASKKG